MSWLQFISVVVGRMVGYVLGDHVTDVVDTRRDDVCRLQDIGKHWTPHLRIMDHMTPL